jgi:hypothetical protein
MIFQQLDEIRSGNIIILVESVWKTSAKSNPTKSKIKNGLFHLHFFSPILTFYHFFIFFFFDPRNLIAYLTSYYLNSLLYLYID